MGKRDRLIRAWPLEIQFENLAKSWVGTFSGPAYANALERLRKATTVDAVEVVRCGNCEFHDGDEEDKRRGVVWCQKLCRYMKENGYCSFGKAQTQKENPPHSEAGM